MHLKTICCLYYYLHLLHYLTMFILLGWLGIFHTNLTSWLIYFSLNQIVTITANIAFSIKLRESDPSWSCLFPNLEETIQSSYSVITSLADVSCRNCVFYIIILGPGGVKELSSRNIPRLHNRKVLSLQQMGWENWISICKRIKLDSYLIS